MIQQELLMELYAIIITSNVIFSLLLMFLSYLLDLMVLMVGIVEITF